MRKFSGSSVATALSASAALFCVSVPSIAQSGPVNGMRPVDLRAHAITGADVVVRPGEVIEDATIIIRDGVIEAVGGAVEVPADARVWSADGCTVYAGFIEPALLVDVPKPPPSPGRHWNGRVHPELRLEDHDALASSLRTSMREMGFTAAAVYPDDGVFRGRGVVLPMASEDEHLLVYRDDPAIAAGFDHGGGWQSARYPGALMGAIALVRQTLSDAEWRRDCVDVYAASPDGKEPPMRADALDALAPVTRGNIPLLFDVDDEHDLLRADRIANEFRINMVMLGSGREFRRLDEVVATGWPLIVPINFPKRPKLSTLVETDRTTLETMMAWEQGPTNPRRLVNAGAEVALTTHRLKSRASFHEHLRTAIEHGLTEAQALAALTTTPAEMLALDDVLGTVESGKVANLIVVEGSIFEKDGAIRDVWVNGRRHEIKPVETLTFEGEATLATSDGVRTSMRIDTTKKTVAVTLPDDGGTAKAKGTVVQAERVSFNLDGRLFDVEGWVQLSGVMDGDRIAGAGQYPDGSRFTFEITPGVAEGLPPAPGAQKAKAEGEGDAGDGEAPNGGADTPGAGGVWRAMVSGGDLPEAIPTIFRLMQREDGGVDGTVEIEVLQFTAQVLEGSFDPDSGELLLSMESPNGDVADLVGTIEGNTFTAEIVGGPENYQAVGERDGDASVAAADDDKSDFVMPPDELVVPLGAYGLTEAPQPQTVAVVNATIWTAADAGIIENGALLVQDGKIAYVGAGRGFRPPRGATVIDAKGRHVTPGLIDCHSHTGIHGGVNEWTQAVTSEVRIGDVVNPDDVNWYRQLAGGLTAANQLHGSANPIGGQNSVVKLKWGGTADDFRIPGAIGGIKFALGENVVRSSGRYPDTRMGVEAIMRDSFIAAREYGDSWDRWNRMTETERQNTYPPRRDLELEALLEILDGERLVHCHSYRQDEILMLIRLADDLGFTIGTFQHVLEGYKVADAIAAHGAGASSFSDWWAYKMEVMDATPWNGAIMTNQGAVVSFNSDSSELARRMNTEASKAVRYGGVEPNEALKYVTLNPARQLRIHERTGSLEVGKDGDFVIWSGDPLSTYTMCEQTWIEGAKYFDLELDRAMRNTIASERERLIQKILAAAHGDPTGEKEAAPEDDAERPDVDDPEFAAAYRRWLEHRLENHGDPTHVQCGECGMNDVWLAYRRWMQNK